MGQTALGAVEAGGGALLMAGARRIPFVGPRIANYLGAGTLVGVGATNVYDGVRGATTGEVHDPILVEAGKAAGMSQQTAETVNRLTKPAVLASLFPATRQVVRYGGDIASTGARVSEVVLGSQAIKGVNDAITGQDHAPSPGTRWLMEGTGGLLSKDTASAIETTAGVVGGLGTVRNTIDNAGNVVSHVRPSKGGPAYEEGFTTATDAATGRVHTFDWFGRNAPLNVREQAARLIQPDADAGTLAALTKDLGKRSFVAWRTGTGPQYSDVAVLQPRWRGHLGVDFARGRVPRITNTHLQHVAGGDGGVRAATAAIEGAGRFLPRQRNVVWDSNTLSPERSAQVTGAQAGNRIILRNAPTVLGRTENLGTQTRTALYGDGATRTSLSLSQQLRNLKNVSAEERALWPAGTERVGYTAQLPQQPVKFMGSRALGPVFHPIQSKD
ncbi:MAG: hypothetical protein ACRDTD_25460, partial [Pseudonocardiaceae bacterium]